MINCRHRILPDQIFRRNFRAQVTHLRPHVPVGQLEPGASKGIGKLFRVLVEVLGDLAVLGILAHRHVGGSHHDTDLLAGILDIRRVVFGRQILWHPLPCTRWALGQLPVITQQHIQVAHIPFDRIGCPGPFQTTGDGIAALAAAEAALPAEALLFNACCFRLCADVGSITCTMDLTEGVAAGGQCHGFVIVHCHASKGFANVASRRQWIRIAIRAFRVHIDQPHLNRSQRVFQITVTGITAIGLIAGGQPLVLCTPVDILLGSPDIGATATKAEGLEAHGLQCHVTGENVQISPGQLAAILLLHRPQQAASLIQVGVIRPAVDGSKALVASRSTATAISSTVSTSRVPSHADHKRTIVTVVCRPPVLGVSHYRCQIFLDLSQIELFEFGGIIELTAHRVRFRVVLVQDGKVELVRPPLFVHLEPSIGPMHYRASASLLVSHVSLRSCLGVISQDRRESVC